MNGNPTPAPPLPPGALPPKKGMSTGCIVALAVGIPAIIVLLVITVIAVLAAISVPAGVAVIKKARDLQVKSQLKGAQLATMGYKVEYSKFPRQADLTSDLDVLETDGSLIPILIGASKSENPREIQFFDVTPSVDGKTGGTTDAHGNLELRDQWGSYYRLQVDVDGDGQIPDPEHPGGFVTGTVIVYSSGPDGNPATWGDNLVSWK